MSQSALQIAEQQLESTRQLIARIEELLAQVADLTSERSVVLDKACEMGKSYAETLPEFMTRAVPMLRQMMRDRQETAREIALLKARLRDSTP